MVSAVPVPERLWEVAPSAGPAALSPADERSIEAGGSGVEKTDLPLNIDHKRITTP
jgi:hypothetical protein|tara:strand:- start:980 stop:1147 length:168 start_codon:yes stop_codon:yes gene_type:complete